MPPRKKPASPRRGPRITRVYTRTGDDGATGLTGGQRVAKDSTRIDAFGTVDELGAALGAARVALESDCDRFDSPADAGKLARHLEYIQNLLFVLGGDLATRVADRHPQMPVAAEEHVAYLERLCDAMNADLAPLKDFILAGGSRTAVALHQARTVCRRAERIVCRLAREEPIGPHAAILLNRLSDALFVLARWTNLKMGLAEPIWDRSPAEPPM